MKSRIILYRSFDKEHLFHSYHCPCIFAKRRFDNSPDVEIDATLPDTLITATVNIKSGKARNIGACFVKTNNGLRRFIKVDRLYT